MKRIVIRVRFEAVNRLWVFRLDTGADAVEATQAAAVRRAVEFAHDLRKAGKLSQVVLHGKNGRIRWERTYPRSSDPRRSKG